MGNFQRDLHVAKTVGSWFGGISGAMIACPSLAAGILASVICSIICSEMAQALVINHYLNK